MHHERRGGAQMHSGESTESMTADNHEIGILGGIE